MTRVTLAVSGMHCDHCVDKVTKALEAVRGVAQVTVFLAEGEAEVDVAAGVAVDGLTAAVAGAGYRATLKTA